MRATKAFPWLASLPTAQSGPLCVLYRSSTKEIYSHLHFSVYGKFEQRKIEEARAIGSILAQDC